MKPEIKNHIFAIWWIIFALFIGYCLYLLDLNGKYALKGQYFVAYLGFIAALFTFFVVDYFRRPNFVICKGSINESPDGKFRFVHVNIINLDWPKWFFLFRRDNVVSTTAEIVFETRNSSKPIFSVPGRWSSNPEPIKIDSKNGQLLFDSDKARGGSFITISPSKNTSDLKEGQLGIAIKFDNENECYGFSDLSYTKNLKFPEWKLQRGIYDVQVIVKSGRFITKKRFIVENLGKNLSDLKLKNECDC